MATLIQNSTSVCFRMVIWALPVPGRVPTLVPSGALLCDHDGLTGIQHHGDRDWNTASLPFHGPFSVAVIVTGMGPFSWEHIP